MATIKMASIKKGTGAPVVKPNIQSGIGYSPLTERIYYGRQNIKNRTWVGEKKDITSNFIAVLMEYIPEDSTRTVFTTDGLRENIVANIVKNKASIKKAIRHLKKILSEISE